MKKLIIVTALLASNHAFSKTLSCFTFPLTTSFFLEMGEKTSELTVIHHNGVEHAPLLNGIMTGYSIDLVKKRFDYVTKMGDRFTTTFVSDKCDLKEDKTSCFNGEPSKIGDLEVEDSYFLAYKETSTSAFGTFVEHQVRFQYRVDKFPHEMAMTYGEQDCEIK